MIYSTRIRWFSHTNTTVGGQISLPFVYQNCICILVPLRHNKAVNKLICNSEPRNSQEAILCNQKLLHKCNLPYMCGTMHVTCTCHSEIPAMIQKLNIFAYKLHLCQGTTIIYFRRNLTALSCAK